MDTEYLKRVGLYVLGALLSLGLVFYFGYHIWCSVTKELETQPVTKITSQRTLEAEGYIFRSEVVVEGSAGGSVIPTVAEGERVNVGGSVANIYSNNAPDTVARIAEIDDKTELLRACLNGGNTSLKDSSSIDSNIYSTLSEIRGAAGSGDASTAVALRPTLVSALNRRGLLTGSSSDISADIAALESERASLTSSLGARLQNVTAPRSGYYYSSVDGYESVFDPALLDDITFDEALTLLASSPGSISGNNAGKMVTSSVWYTLFKASRKYVNIFETGTTCRAEFKSNEMTLTMKVEKVLEGKDEAIFVLSTREVPSGFDFSRVQKLELIEAEYTGLRVPVGAVRIVDGVTGVYVLDGSTVRFRAISVLYRGDGVCIVDPDPDGAKGDEDEEDQDDGTKTPWLGLHDNLIVSGKGLFDGKVVGS